MTLAPNTRLGLYEIVGLMVQAEWAKRGGQRKWAWGDDTMKWLQRTFALTLSQTRSPVGFSLL